MSPSGLMSRVPVAFHGRLLYRGGMTGMRNAAVAAEIRAEKARQNLSGRRLAEMLGMPPTTVARYLRGHVDMSIDDIEKFAEALGVTTADLIDRAYANTPTPPFSPSPRGVVDTAGAVRRRNIPCYSDVVPIIGPWKRPVVRRAIVRISA